MTRCFQPRFARRSQKRQCPAGYIVTALTHPLLGRPLVKALAFGSSVPEIDGDDLAEVQIVRLKSGEDRLLPRLQSNPQRLGCRRPFGARNHRGFPKDHRQVHGRRLIIKTSPSLHL